VLAGRFEATCRSLDPRGEEEGSGPVTDRGGVAGRVDCAHDSLCTSAVAEHDPGPAEPVDEVERQERVVDGAPGQGGVDVGALGAGEGEMVGLTAAAHPLGGGSGCFGEPSGVSSDGALGHPGVGHRFQRERSDAVE